MAEAIKEHYFPLNAGSELPASIEGKIVSIADKIDTISSVFLTTQKDKKKKRPTGSNDPLGVRRAAIGILRIIIESGLKININNLVDFSVNKIAKDFNLDVENSLKTELLEFIIDRLFVMFEEDFDIEILEALRKNSPLSNLKAFKEKCENLKSQKELQNFKDFVEQAKRISRITEGVDKNLLLIDVNSAELKSEEEKNLLIALNSLSKADCVQDLYYLTPVIGKFFEAVLVNDENVKDKNNRLSLLLKLRNKFESFADFTKFKKQ